MSRKTFSHVLARAARVFVASASNATRDYVLAVAPVLAALQREFADDVAGLRKAWKQQNVAAYRAAGLRKGMAQYGRLSALSSMVLTVSMERPSAFAGLVAGKYGNIRKLYDAIGNRSAKGGKGRKASPVSVKLARFLSSLSPRQRVWVLQNVRKVAASL